MNYIPKYQFQHGPTLWAYVTFNSGHFTLIIEKQNKTNKTKQNKRKQQNRQSKNITLGCIVLVIYNYS